MVLRVSCRVDVSSTRRMNVYLSDGCSTHIADRAVVIWKGQKAALLVATLNLEEKRERADSQKKAIRP